LIIDPSLDSANFSAKVFILQPINIGNFLSINNSSDKNKGPLLGFSFKTNPILWVSGEIDGAVLFGIEVVTKISLENDFLKFFISGNIFGLFSAQFDGLLKKESSGFTLNIRGELQFGDSLKSIVKEVIKRFIDKIKPGHRFTQMERRRLKKASLVKLLIKVKM
jgi:hypothetical protein